MEAVGQLAGGIAHDFNNVLTVVLGFADLALLELRKDGGGPLSAYLQEIKHAGEHAATLTRQLLAFSRKQMLETRVFNANPLVTDLERMLHRLVSDDVELVTCLDEHLWPIEADPGQLEQAIMNLVINANDAMPNGGRLTIETANLVVDEELAAHHVDVNPGSYVLIAVSDTGVGMDDTTLQRIFEPFFTTKEVGKGTGLGLSTVFGIVKQSGGDISVYSEPGYGTTFKIYLPRTLGAPSPALGPVDTDDLPAGDETILLVDDDEHVRAFEREVLTERGYTVVEATGAHDAIRSASSYDGPIHLLVTDVVMPGMSGPDLAEQIGRLRPETKILYTSGYTSGALVHQGVVDHEIGFLAKPLTRRTVVRKVRELLDSDGPMPVRRRDVRRSVAAPVD
jgi:CheY-like chemotaxis protein